MIEDATSALAKVKLEPDMKGLPHIPCELINEIASHLGPDVNKFRTANKRFHVATSPSFHREMARDRHIYPRYANMARFLQLLSHFPLLVEYMRTVDVISEGLREHEYRSGWAWEDLAIKEGKGLNMQDSEILYEIDEDHVNEVVGANTFIFSGRYRAMFGQILGQLHRVHTINVRKLKNDEHIPGWVDTDKFKQISIYRPGIEIKEVYYGDWQYDILQQRVTMYVDEFGDNITEANAGPQSSFDDDFTAGVTASGFNGRIVYA
ncbi:hypothetical protein EK21DRAFT_115196 [Setomelanomma holmii]|uniref:F-box domain-containing protein n=1 Tax=Setomelanomma holmii TaxID=210430 RepID=A0A9P4LIZ5_9PLEO|nr:hypothetical protein EK21DRAFT_115196 [Setomelanomma holmii]